MRTKEIIGLCGALFFEKKADFGIIMLLNMGFIYFSN